MQWSDAQLKAIETKHKNLLVAAAAGSGKTAVLVERIIKRLLAGECDVDRLLVVTFTNAAAAEMRQRIEAALQAELERQPGSERLERQLVLLSNASISTMHAFCQNIIRRNFSAIDLDPKFRLANEQELALMQQDVLETLFEDEYEAQQEDFLRFTEEYGSARGDDALYDILLQLFRYAQSQPFPEEWLAGLADMFQLPAGMSLEQTVWMPVVWQTLEQTLAGCQEDAAWLLEQADMLDCAFYEKALESDLAVLQSLQDALKTRDWEILQRAFLGIKFAVMRAPKGTDEDLKVRFTKPRDKMKKKLATLQQTYFAQSAEELLEDMRAAAPTMQLIVRLTLAFASGFAAAKKEKTVLDFNDLEHFALQILLSDERAPGTLVPSEIAKALQQKYQEVMVDEYQDTNGVQEAILSLVTDSARANLFAVGDVKQSIYRFRLADPLLFLQKYKTYPELGSAYERIDLAQNFRSRPEVLAAINFLFAQVMVPETMELAYDDAAALHPGPDYRPADGETLSGPVELDIIDREATRDEDESEGDELKGFALEAQHIAYRLRTLLESGVLVFDKAAGGYRPIRWRDMVVLLRSVRGKADVLLETLRKADIPAYASVDAGYFEETEVRVMLSLLSVLDNARQDIPLAAVLYSPIGKLTTEELAELRLFAPEQDLFAALLAANAPEAKLAEPLREKCAVFLAQLTKWRSLARRVGVPELIWQLYRDTGYYEYVGGMPGGLLRQANLRMLCDRAADYERTNFRGLFRFLRFIHKMQAMETDLSVARTLGESEDVVRIMSVHKSKGLEFPVVIVADLGKKFNLMDAHDTLLVHRVLGLGPYRTEVDKSLRYPTFAREAVAAKIVQENKAEEMRVLYVALTRAREKLILVGSVKKLAVRANAWCRYVERAALQLPAHAALDAECYLDWICLAVARHPEGDVLRALADVVSVAPTAALVSDASHWQVQIVPAHTIQAAADGAEKEDPILSAIEQRQPLPDSPVCSKVRALLNWQYDLRGMEDVPAKLSVTELKRRFTMEDASGKAAAQMPAVQNQTEETAFQRPAFVRETTRLTGTEYGTIMHSVMQHMDVHGDLSLAGITRQIDAFVDRELLLPKQRKAVQETAVQQFFQGPLGTRLRMAQHLWREMPFSRMLQAKRFYPSVQDKNEQIFIQGIIDVLFEEEDGQLVLLDYKTDKDTCPEKISNRYQLQISLYAEAVEAILGKKIKEKYLYMLHDGSVVVM